jgi:hypothetical protein
MNYCKRIIYILIFILTVSLFPAAASYARQGGHNNWNKQFSTMQKRWGDRRDHMRNNWNNMQERWQDGWNTMRERQQDRREQMRDNWNNMWNSGGHRGGGNR